MIRNDPEECCTTRSGRAKTSFTSRADARRVAKHGTRTRRTPLEEYPCIVYPGRWHIRDARRHKRRAKRAARQELKRQRAHNPDNATNTTRREEHPR